MTVLEAPQNESPSFSKKGKKIASDLLKKIETFTKIATSILVQMIFIMGVMTTML